MTNVAQEITEEMCKFARLSPNGNNARVFRGTIETIISERERAIQELISAAEEATGFMFGGAEKRLRAALEAVKTG